MNVEISISESCETFFECITPDSIVNSLVTVIGIFLSSFFTFIIMRREQKHDLIINHQKFYGSADTLKFWLEQLIDRLEKLSELNDYRNEKDVEDQLETLNFVVKQLFDSVPVESAPYPLKTTLIEINSNALQASGYSKSILRALQDEKYKKIKIGDAKGFYIERIKMIKKYKKKVDKYL